MDSWSPDQLKIMKTSSNEIDNKSRYQSAQAQPYKQDLKSEALGTPLPAAAPVPATRVDMSRGDLNGMESFRDSDAEYVAPQSRLEEEARTRMAVKFGNFFKF